MKFIKLSKTQEENLLKSKTKINFEEMKMIKEVEIGRGSYGTVFQCRFKGFIGTYAVKEFNKSKNPTIHQLFEREKKILKDIEHRNVISLLGSKETIEYDYLIFEYYNLNLKNLLLSNDWKMINDDSKLTFCLEISQVIEYIHSKQIVHLDIKSSNILIDQQVKDKGKIEYHLILSDFGSSRKIENLQMNMNEYIGTPAYMAPEIQRCDSSPQLYNPFLADIYSMGCVLLEIILGYGKRFRNLTDSEKKYVEINTVLKIIEECCQENPNKRPTCIQFENRFEGKKKINIFFPIKILIYFF